MIGDKKHILMMTVGKSPAVITEMVYALAKNPERGAPDEVIVITTEKGRNKIIEQLLDSGVWKQMKKDLKISSAFGKGEANIKVIPNGQRDDNSQDVTTTDGVYAMADFLMDTLRSYTERADTVISCSIAGGRKSMSAVGGLVMTLLGRKDDKLYHILVDEFFTNPNLQPPFFYPIPGVMYPSNDESGEPKLSEKSNLQLCEIPFVRCRYWFQDKGIEQAGYCNMVENFNGNQVQITVNARKNELRINGSRVEGLSTLEFTLYWMFAERYKEGKEKLRHGENGILLEEVLEDFFKANDFVNRDQGKKPADTNVSGLKYGPREYGNMHTNKDYIASHGISSLNEKLNKLRNEKNIEIHLSLKDEEITRNCWGISTTIPKESITIITD